jgi:hypothetical protein
VWFSSNTHAVPLISISNWWLSSNKLINGTVCLLLLSHQFDKLINGTVWMILLSHQFDKLVVSFIQFHWSVYQTGDLVVSFIQFHWSIYQTGAHSLLTLNNDHSFTPSQVVLTLNNNHSFTPNQVVLCFSTGTPVSFTNKTDLHDITEILLKVALNTINPNLNHIWSEDHRRPLTINMPIRSCYMKPFTCKEHTSLN